MSDSVEVRQFDQPEQLFRLLVESVKDYAIYHIDPTGIILTWNKGAERIKGYTADEIIGKHFSIFYPPQEVRRGKPEYELRVAADEGRWDEEGWRVRGDGTRFWAHVVITALYDTNNTLVGFAKVTHDLSERKRAEEERALLLDRERHARLQAEATLEQLRMIQEVNEVALAHFTVDELLHALLDPIGEALIVDTIAVLLLDDASRSLVLRTARGIDAAAEQGARLPLGNGFAGLVATERRPIVLADVKQAGVPDPLLDANTIQSLLGVPLLLDGRLLGVLHVGTRHRRNFTPADVRILQLVADRVALAIDRAQLFEAARQAQAEADVVEITLRAQEELLSVAAHELKTPLTSAKLAAELLLRQYARHESGSNTGPIDPPLRRPVELIDQQLDKLDRLVTQLLEAMRLQARRSVLNPVPTNVTELVHSVVEQTQTRTTRHEIITPATESLWARIDPMRFEQVVANLIDNAIKFSPAGGPIDVAVTRPQPHIIQLAVRDHGIGVPVEHRSHIFERFYQAHASSHQSGLGLGLYICQEIVAQHGGTILAEFPRDGGTRMVVTVPSGIVEGAPASVEGNDEARTISTDTRH